MIPVAATTGAVKIANAFDVKQPVDHSSRLCTVHYRVPHYFTMCRIVFRQKLPLPFEGSGPPRI